MMDRKEVPFTFGPDRSIQPPTRERRADERGWACAVRSEVCSRFVGALVWFGREFSDTCERSGDSPWFIVGGIAVALCILYARAQGWLL